MNFFTNDGGEQNEPAVAQNQNNTRLHCCFAFRQRDNNCAAIIMAKERRFIIFKPLVSTDPTGGR